MPNKKLQTNGFSGLYDSIRGILSSARSCAYRAVNFAMVKAYWEIGRLIVEEEQKGKAKAEFGKYMIKELAEVLTNEYGKGFTEANLRYMRLFYLNFPFRHAVRDELTWTHYRLLLKVKDEESRQFYMDEAISCNWSTRELERQINSHLYERIGSKRENIKQVSQRENTVHKPSDLIKDPYVLEFLNLDASKAYLEKDLEKLLVDKLKEFLLELGKGFYFVARQKRINVGDDNYYIDLVFYNYLLKCFVLIDLKMGKLSPRDVGQMDFYVRYYEAEIRQNNDNLTIGLILCSEKNDAVVKYTILNESKNIFASKYKLYLPTEDELKTQITRERQLAEQEKRLEK